jgi:hypothetical protein
MTMGDEARCVVKAGERRSAGTARLESTELRFRGEFRLTIPFREMRTVDARDGVLHVSFPEGTAAFELGPLAEKWANKIRNPKSVLDKLGVKANQKIGVVGPLDAKFIEQLEQRSSELAVGHPRPDSDLIFIAADRTSDLRQLKSLQRYLKRNGAIWVVRPKGGAGPTEREVMEAGKSAGLVDTKVVSLTATHTAERYVIPVSRR